LHLLISKKATKNLIGIYQQEQLLPLVAAPKSSY